MNWINWELEKPRDRELILASWSHGGTYTCWYHEPINALIPHDGPLGTQFTTLPVKWARIEDEGE